MLKLNDSKRRTIGLYLINILALMPLLCFAFQHFSTDTYVYLADGLNGHCIQWISCFRYFGALISKISFLFGDNPIVSPFFDVIFFILTVALSITFFSRFVYRQLEKKSRLNYIIINVSVLISVTNVWFINILTFPECIFPTAVGVVLCFTAIYIYFSKQNIAGKVISAVLLICSTAIFQQFLVVFLIYSVLLCGIKLNNANSTAKAVIIEYLKLIAIILISGIIYYGVGICVQKLFSVVANERASLKIDTIIENLIYFITHQHSYLKGRGVFDSEILTLCYLIVGAVWFVAFIYHIKKDKINFKNLCLFLSYFVAYASSFLMLTITTSRVCRAVFGLFTVFALFSIGSILLMNKRIVKYILALTLVFVVALNMYANLEMSLDQREVNTQDMMIAEQYLYEIEKYEKAENVVVDKIEFCSDVNPEISVDSALNNFYSFRSLMTYISGRDFYVTEMTNEEIRKSFEEKDWDILVEEEQLIFEEDTLYVCVC